MRDHEHETSSSYGNDIDICIVFEKERNDIDQTAFGRNNQCSFTLKQSHVRIGVVNQKTYDIAAPTDK